MAKGAPRGDLLRTKTITIEDGGKDVTFILGKMPASIGFGWSSRLTEFIVKAGIPIPQNIGNAIQSFADKAKDGNFLLQIPGFSSVAFQNLVWELIPYAMIKLKDEVTGEELNAIKCTKENIDQQLVDFLSIYQLAYELFKFNFDFFSIVDRIMAALAARRSTSSDTQTSTQQSGQ